MRKALLGLALAGALGVSPAFAIENYPSSASIAGLPNIETTATSLVVGQNQGNVNLYGFTFTQGSTAGYFALLDATVAPASGAAISPVECVPVAANGYLRERVSFPDLYLTGIVLLATTSCSTYTPNPPVLMGVNAK